MEKSNYSNQIDNVQNPLSDFIVVNISDMNDYRDFECININTGEFLYIDSIELKGNSDNLKLGSIFTLWNNEDNTIIYRENPNNKSILNRHEQIRDCYVDFLEKTKNVKTNSSSSGDYKNDYIKYGRAMCILSKLLQTNFDIILQFVNKPDDYMLNNYKKECMNLTKYSEIIYNSPKTIYSPKDEFGTVDEIFEHLNDIYDIAKQNKTFAGVNEKADIVQHNAKQTTLLDF